jgi:hypothetical protein
MLKLLLAPAIFLIAALPTQAGESLNAALAKAAQQLRLDVIDFDAQDCADARTFGEWLRDTVGSSARSIRWRGGECRLRVAQAPRDSGTSWCGFALVTPKGGGSPARVEINFERPQGARPGQPIAFRGVVPEKGSGEMLRHPFEFKLSWRAVHDPASVVAEDSRCP